MSAGQLAAALASCDLSLRYPTHPTTNYFRIFVQHHAERDINDAHLLFHQISLTPLDTAATIESSVEKNGKMTSSLSDIITALPDGDGWGPPPTSETTLNGVPYAPFSKGDKLGRMADWANDGKDGREGRGGRAQYNRFNRMSWRSPPPVNLSFPTMLTQSCFQLNRFMAPDLRPYSRPPRLKTNPASLSSAMFATPASLDMGVAQSSSVVGAASVAVAGITDKGAAIKSSAEVARASNTEVATTDGEAADRTPAVEAVGLAGRIMTNRPGLAMLPSISRLIGS